MNKWSHFLAALGLAIMAFVIHILVRNDSNVIKLDTVRLYTMTRDKGSPSMALSAISTWPGTDDCAKRTNLTIPAAGDATIAACVTSRTTLRKNILDAMKCDIYNSQVCTLLQKIMNGIISSNTTFGNNGSDRKGPWI